MPQVFPLPTDIHKKIKIAPPTKAFSSARAAGHTVKQTHQALLESMPHRWNMSRPEFSQVGLAVVKSKWGVLAVQMFVEPPTDNLIY